MLHNRLNILSAKKIRHWNTVRHWRPKILYKHDKGNSVQLFSDFSEIFYGNEATVRRS